MSDAESPLLGKPEVAGPPQRESGYCMDVDGGGKLACAPTAKGKRCLFGVICPLFVAGAVLGAVLLVDFARSGRSSSSSGSSSSSKDDWSSTQAVNGCERDPDSGTHYCSYGSEEFLKFAKVRNFLEGQGANVSDADDLKTFLPTLMTIEYTPRYMEQQIGSQMLDAYVAFSLYLPKQLHISDGTTQETAWVNASYMIVVHQNGSLKSVAPTSNLDDDHVSGGTHMTAFKFMSPSEVITYSNDFMHQEGYPYTWQWGQETETDTTPRLERLVSTRRWSAHDIQMAKGGQSYWQPTDPAHPTGNYTFSEIDRLSGDALNTYLLKECVDMNHVQVLEDEHVVIISCRISGSVVKYDLDSRHVRWTAGGDNGTLTLVDEDGTTYPPGSSLWSGQHNAEYFGDNKYFLFDNQYDQMTPSRLLVFAVDEDAGTATVEYTYTFFDTWPHGYSEVFGDNDQLPTGNMLTCWWPNALSPARDLQYDTQLLEVTHSKEIAWQMSIFGQHECDGGSDHLCNRNIDVGWKVYSLEKLYMRPPLYNATFINGTLSFTTHTQFKTSAKTTGTWRLTLDDGDQTLAEVPFDWEAHFRATVVEAVVDADVPVGSTLGLYVANEFDTESYLPIVVGEKWSRTDYYDDDA